MNRKIFRAIFFSTFISLLLALGAVLFITHEEIASTEQERLVRVNELLAAGYNAVGLEFLQNTPHDPYRVTLIEPDGQVVFDSMRKEPLANHQNREEFKEALAEGHGSSERWSETLDTQTYYYAETLQDGRVLRAAITTDSLLALSLRMLAYFVIIILVLGALSLYFASKISKAILMPLYNIDLNHPLAQDCYEEIKPFLTEIDKKQRQIDEQITRARSKNEEFLTITKSMAEGLVLLNRDGIILTINKTAKKIFSLSDDCIGRSFMALERGEQAREFFNPNSKFTKRSCEIEKDGRDYHLRFNQIKVDGQVAGYALLIIDVTETKRAEAQRQEFTANVSHELKTPLQSIIGSAELIESGIVRPEDLASFAGRIREQGTRLISLIEDIIFLSSLDEGSGSGLFEQVSLNKIVSEVFEVLAPKAQERQVELRRSGPDLTFPAVYRYIYELIYNLCDNAVNYNRPGGFAEVHTAEHENKYVIEVRDNGIGIAKEHLSRIFERFYRVDKSHSRATGGTGLGLSIVKRTVLFHHGKIKLKSEPEAGSVFKITLYKKELAKLSTGIEPERRENTALEAASNKAQFFAAEAEIKAQGRSTAVKRARKSSAALDDGLLNAPDALTPPGSAGVSGENSYEVKTMQSALLTKGRGRRREKRLTPRRAALRRINM